MSDTTGAGGTEEFARLLRDLKARSGLSYGSLAKRLHMSTSTLHRYCNGTALPHEFAPAERLARACRATPDELVELHRHWILATAARANRAERPADPASGPDPVGTPVPVPGAAGEGDEGGEGGAPVVVASTRGTRQARRRRTALIASAAALAVVTAAVLVVRSPFGGGAGGGGGGDGSPQRAAGAAPSVASDATGAAQAGRAPATTVPPVGGTSPRPPGPSAATTGPSAAVTTGPSAAASDGPQGGGPALLTVGTRPYVYTTPCSQHFLVQSGPAKVGPPANEPEAPRWAAAYGAVSSGEQRIALTVQGTGADTVVLEALHVRIVAKGAPLAWNDYAMGVGCGGSVDTGSFDIDLDKGSPKVTPGDGQRDFPYKVSKADPEVFYVTARTGAHDVRWDLTLDWSSGGRRGTVRIDNAGTAFRTSAATGRPGYDYPLGGGEWVRRVEG